MTVHETLGGENLYRIKPHLAVFKTNSNDIHVGSMPPAAVVIRDCPDYLSDLLEFVSVSRSFKEIQSYLLGKWGMEPDESRSVINELIEHNIIFDFDYDVNYRYSRHQLYFDIHGYNPEKLQHVLASKKVGLVGMGGIGSNVAMMLAGAGVGNLVFSDGDHIEESNLTRQFLYNEALVGLSKVEAAKKQLQALNSTLNYHPVPESFVGEALLDKYFADCDFV